MTTTDACSASNNTNGGGYDCRTGQKKPLTDKNTRCVETVIGQLVEYFERERARIQDKWHLTSQTARKLLGFVVGAIQKMGNCQRLDSNNKCNRLPSVDFERCSPA